MKMFEELIHQVGVSTGEPALLSQISHACYVKQAFCFGDEHSRVVLRLLERDGHKYMLVWAGVSRGQGALAKFTPIVTEICRGAGAQWFEFCTRRRGFIRVANRYGFVRLSDDAQGRMWFRKEVN